MTKVNLIYGVGVVMQTHININPFEEKADNVKVVRTEITNINKNVNRSLKHN